MGWLDDLRKQLACTHEWEATHVRVYYDHGVLVTEECTKCGATRWYMAD